MQDNTGLANHVVEQLGFLGRISSRAIFGGIGIFHDERLLGIVINGGLYLHTGPTNLDDYVARGMPQFKPYPNAFDLTTDHHQVPADILADAEQLKEWGRRALDAAIEGAKGKKLASLARARDKRAKKRQEKGEEE